MLADVLDFLVCPYHGLLVQCAPIIPALLASARRMLDAVRR